MSFLQRQLEDPVRLKRIKRLSIAVLVLVVVFELVVLFATDAHHHFAVEALPAFGSLYGLLSCVVIIVVSKLIGKLFLMKREDHYDD